MILNLDKMTYVISYNKETRQLLGDKIITILDIPSGEPRRTWTVTHLGTDSQGVIDFRNSNLENRVLIQIVPGTQIPEGVYSFPFTIQSDNPNDTIAIFKIDLSVRDEVPDPEPEPEQPCNLKYFMEWTSNDKDHLHFRADICYKGFQGEATQIYGYCDLERPEVKDILDCVRGASINMVIHANPDLDIRDIYFEEEQTAKVTLYKENEVMFIGWLKPDGIWRSYTDEYYNITLDATDGLGSLKNLAFVDELKRNFVGRITQIKAIKAILDRTGLKLPINVFISKRHNEMLYGQCPLEFTQVNPEQYYKEDGSTLMDCEKVLKSLLEPYNATIFQENGEWYIISMADLNENITFSVYEDGELTGYKEHDLSLNIGSSVDGYETYHINKNQQLRYEGSLGAFRVGYKYGKPKSILSNYAFRKDNFGNLEGWNLLNGFITDYGVRATQENVDIIESDQLVQLNEGDDLSFIFDFTITGDMWRFDAEIKVGNYYLAGRHWTTTPSKVRLTHMVINGIYFEGAGRTTIEVNANPLPDSGNLYVKISTLDRVPLSREDGELTVHSLKMQISSTDTVVGEFHTIIRDGNSSIVKPNKEVYNADSQSDAYLGTLYDQYGEPTEYWRRSEDVEEQYPLLATMVIDAVLMSNKPSIKFDGDVKGEVKQLSLYNINKVGDRLFPMGLTYRTKDNITELSGREVFNEFNNNYEYTLTYNYNESTTPTIN